MKNYLNLKKQYYLNVSSLLTLAILVFTVSGCWIAAAGVGAEAGYVVSQEDRSAGDTVTDQVITSKIKTILLADSEVSGLNINVDTFKGEVTLKGVVESRLEADKAIDLAQSVAGVKVVISKLVLENKAYQGRYY